MAEKLTMADIAELAGVTKSTVSRYFNGGSIKEETRKKIQNVVKENNYIPNSFCKAESQRKQYSWCDRPYFELKSDQPCGHKRWPLSEKSGI